MERQLIATQGARQRLVDTERGLSMDGYLAPLDEISDLAMKYTALVMVDDTQAMGFVGPGGEGTPALFGVQDGFDIVTGTLGKALGAASGGMLQPTRRSSNYFGAGPGTTCSRTQCLRQLSPNHWAPSNWSRGGGDQRETLRHNSALSRNMMVSAGLTFATTCTPQCQ